MAQNEPYKLEILDSIKEEPITIYHVGKVSEKNTCFHDHFILVVVCDVCSYKWLSFHHLIHFKHQYLGFGIDNMVAVVFAWTISLHDSWISSTSMVLKFYLIGPLDEFLFSLWPLGNHLFSIITTEICYTCRPLSC